MFNRNSTTPEIIKQAAERKKIQPRRSVLRIVSELSATLTLPGYGRVARDPTGIHPQGSDIEEVLSQSIHYMRRVIRG
jgi:hypothetical protein